MRFVKESRIAASPAKVFAFHESAGALERINPPWEKLQVLKGAESIRPENRATIRTKVGPFWLIWVAEYTEYESGRMFADRQVRGPFSSWYHRHWCLDDGAGGTLLRDEIEYQPPLGAFGRWIAGGFLEKKLTKLFDYRHEATRRIVEAGDFPSDGH